MTPSRVPSALVLVMVAVLLAAGCTSPSPAATPSSTASFTDPTTVVPDSPPATNVVPVTPKPTAAQRNTGANATFWIRIDPVGKHYTHDVFQITGTSNLPAGERLIYDISRPNQPPRTPLVGGSMGDISPPPLATTVSAGKDGNNTWSFTFNAEYYREPGTYRVDIWQEMQVFPEYVRANTSFVLALR